VKEINPAQPQQAVRGQPTTALSALGGHVDAIHLMAVLFAIGLTVYLAIEPTQGWLLLLLAGLAALGTDGIIRTHPRARRQRLDDMALYLIVPVLFTLSVGLFLEEAAEGFWTLPAGLLIGVPFWAILYSEYVSVDRRAPHYQSARLILNVATYVTAFLFFATIYDFDLGLLSAAFATGIVSLLLAIEVLREEALDVSRMLLYALAIGLVLSEGAWAIHFLPLEAGIAAVSLLLAFYLMTGLMHNHLARRLDIRTAGEFTGIAMIGLLIVTLSQAYI
jgi:hypothetical protein